MVSKTCQNCKNEFVLDEQERSLLQKLKVPDPTFCPSCRAQRRMVFRNESILYRSTCDLCKKSIVSMYPKSTPYTVYCTQCWNSDKWDPFDCGRKYDLSKPFFQQFHELNNAVPKLARFTVGTNENSYFSNYILNVRDVYLSSSALNSESILYSRSIDDCNDIVDSFYLQECENCYELVDCFRCFSCAFCTSTTHSSESRFLFACVSCQNCFMSSNQRKKQYVFQNQQLTKKQYESEMQKIDFGNPKVAQELQKEFTDLVKNSIHCFANLRNTENSTGNNLQNTKNSHFVFDCYEFDNVRYSIRSFKSTDSMDVQNYGGELSYEAVSTATGVYHHQFTASCGLSADIEYSEWCMSCNNIFGSVGLKKQEFCIFNKKYSPSDFATLREEIIKHMDTMPYIDKKGRLYKYGEFFPIELADFAYNQSYVFDHFPLTKEQCLTEGYKWYDEEPLPYKPTLQAGALPKTSEATDALLREVVACEKDERAFKIVKKELAFLKSKNLPLPRMCPKCRQHARFEKRLPFKLWKRTCMCQGKKDSRNKTEHFHKEATCTHEFMTPYSPERAESVYCEQCYQAEVV